MNLTAVQLSYPIRPEMICSDVTNADQCTQLHYTATNFVFHFIQLWRQICLVQTRPLVHIFWTSDDKPWGWNWNLRYIPNPEQSSNTPWLILTSLYFAIRWMTVSITHGIRTDKTARLTAFTIFFVNRTQRRLDGGRSFSMDPSSLLQSNRYARWNHRWRIAKWDGQGRQITWTSSQERLPKNSQTRRRKSTKWRWDETGGSCSKNNEWSSRSI